MLYPFFGLCRLCEFMELK